MLMICNSLFVVFTPFRFNQAQPCCQLPAILFAHTVQVIVQFLVIHAGNVRSGAPIS